MAASNTKKTKEEKAAIFNKNYNPDFFECDDNTPLTFFIDMGADTYGKLMVLLKKKETTFYIVNVNGVDNAPHPKDQKVRVLTFNGTISEYTTIGDLLQKSGISSMDYCCRGYSTKFSYISKRDGIRYLGVYNTRLNSIRNNTIFVQFKDN